MDWTLEVVVLPVSDINRSIEFYRDRVGFNLDHHTRNEHMEVAQLTPPGSVCSIVFGTLITEADGGTFFGFEDPDGNSWAVQEIRARARKPLIPKDHVGLGEWAGRRG
jgi:catechol 2,3-dioxygenase-like lactoylglutathione lyase family enzyme